MSCITLKNQDLKRFNTLGLSAQAAFVYLPLNCEDLVAALAQPHKRFITIGKGSNLFIKKTSFDQDTAFIVTHLMDSLELVEDEIIADAGLSLHRLAWFALEHSIKDFAFCEDIPGSLGGALIMNAGQYEFTISQFVNWVEVYDVDKKVLERIVPDENFFTYRHASFTANQIITRASLKAIKGNQVEELEQIYNYKRNRYLKQPREYANAGSVFKRPTHNGETLYVWKLLEACELRGFRIQDAQVSDKHPGFIINRHRATAQDISNLLDLCQKKVKEKFDVELELEWKVIE